MLEIEIVYGTAEKQILRSIRIEQGATARMAVLQSGLDKDFPELDLNAAPLGIFGKRVKDDFLLRERDRIEIYRPLLIDPKEARRKRIGQTQ